MVVVVSLVLEIIYDQFHWPQNEKFPMNPGWE